MRGIPSPTRTADCIILALLLLGSALISWGAEPPPSFEVEVHGAGSPVLLVPGLSCSGEVWDQTVTALEGRHEVHVLSLAGFAGRKKTEAIHNFGMF